MKVTSSNSHDSDLKGSKSILDVPAAQFDWNSSGLINPLDGEFKTFRNLTNANETVELYV